MNSEFTHPRWEAIWAKGLQPGQLFDALAPSPCLLKYLDGGVVNLLSRTSSQRLFFYLLDGLVPFGRALVPGCGRGYDVTALAHDKRIVLGLDISTTAIDAATERLQSLSDEECSSKSNAQFSTSSFFDFTISNDEYFDFIYDYTFLCALNPSIRETWADKMTELLRPGSGELFTLIFPIAESSEPLSGPPFPVSLQLLKDLLIPRGFECLELRMLPPELCHPGRDGSDSIGASGLGRWRKI